MMRDMSWAIHAWKVQISTSSSSSGIIKGKGLWVLESKGTACPRRMQHQGCMRMTTGTTHLKYGEEKTQHLRMLNSVNISLKNKGKMNTYFRCQPWKNSPADPHEKKCSKYAFRQIGNDVKMKEEHMR